MFIFMHFSPSLDIKEKIFKKMYMKHKIGKFFRSARITNV